jgi:hypothetical protein
LPALTLTPLPALTLHARAGALRQLKSTSTRRCGAQLTGGFFTGPFVVF